MKIKIKWDRVVGMGILCLMVAVMVWIGLMQATEPHAAPSPNVPVCTDRIADAGGICIGDPITEPDAVVTLDDDGIHLSHPGTLPPCVTEDSDDCYWDGDTRGNRSGLSFYTIDGTTTYEDGTTVTWEE